MVKEALVDKDISDGKKLIQSLDKTSFKVKSAFWLYTSELGEWSLFLTSDYVNSQGEKKGYEFIQKELLNFDQSFGISLSNISVVKTNNEWIRLLRILIRTGENDLSEIRSTRNVINGTMIEDALIYRLP